MRAMVLEKPGGILECRDIPRPQPGAGQLLLKVRACGICRTDLHVLDGDLTDGILCDVGMPVQHDEESPASADNTPAGRGVSPSSCWHSASAVAFDGVSTSLAEEEALQRASNPTARRITVLTP